MAVVEDGVVRPIGLLDLIERLRNQEALEAVAGHEGQRRFEKIEPTECREFIEHQEQPMPASLTCGSSVRRRPI